MAARYVDASYGLLLRSRAGRRRRRFWGRKAPPGSQSAFVATHDTDQPDQTRGADDLLAELQLGNSRLRRLVADLLLEKIRRVTFDCEVAPGGGTVKANSDRYCSNDDLLSNAAKHTHLCALPMRHSAICYTNTNGRPI
jgi:hypothetical protein